MRILPYVIIASSLFISCLNEESKNNPLYTLVLVDSITFEPLPKVNVNSYCVKYYKEGNREYLFWGSRPRNSIDIFEINSGNYYKTIQFPREGPNGISSINRGFSVLSMDSIFISSGELGKIHMFDTSGILRKTFYHSDSNYYSANNLIGLNTKVFSDIYKMNSALVFPFDTPQFPVQPSDEIVYDLQVVKLYDLTKDRFRNSGLHFDPAIYEPNSLFIANSNTKLGDRYFYQIATQSEIRYTDDFFNMNRKEARSQYHTEYIKMSDYSNDYFGYIAREFSYRSLIADIYRQLIYRTVKLPVQDIHTADLGKEFDDVYEKISIMILDKELNIKGERLFNHSNYSWNECFVGKKGLYILRSPYHPLYSEPRITYDIYMPQITK